MLYIETKAKIFSNDFDEDNNELNQNGSNRRYRSFVDLSEINEDEELDGNGEESADENEESMEEEEDDDDNDDDDDISGLKSNKSNLVIKKLRIILIRNNVIDLKEVQN